MSTRKTIETTYSRETTENHLISISHGLYAHGQEAVFRDWDPTTPRLTEEEQTAIKVSLDEDEAISIVSVERLSSEVRERQESIREDSLKNISGGVQLPLDGRAKDHSSGKGEKAMYHVPYTASEGFNAVKAVLESHPDDVERLLVELSEAYKTIKTEELERRLAHLSDVLSQRKGQVTKAYSWTRTALVASIVVLFGIVLFQITDAIANFTVPFYVKLLVSVVGVMSGLFVVVAARLFYKVRGEANRQEFLQWSVNDRIGILKEKRQLQAS